MAYRRPVGWRMHSYEHGLAARGIVTRYQRKFPHLVKPYRGQNPRLTPEYARFRQLPPREFVEDSFRIKKTSPDTAIILGKKKRDGFGVQSVLVKREKYWSKKDGLHVEHVVTSRGEKFVVMWNDVSLEKYPSQESADARLKELEEKSDAAFHLGYYAERRVEKKGKVHVTRSGVEVKRLASDVERSLQPFVSRSAIAGSIRRGSSEPTDVDIVVVPKGDAARDAMRERLRERSSVVYQDGDEKFSGRIRGVKVEVVFSRPDEWGAQLLTTTGPNVANIHKRAVAKDKGWLLNQRGLFDKGGRRVAVSERDIYRRLGLSYLPPSERGKPRDVS